MQYNFQPYLRTFNFDLTAASNAGLSIPELSDGFDSQIKTPKNGITDGLADGITDEFADGMAPVSFYSGEVPAGIYAVHLTLTALRDVERLFLFSGRKLLRDIISLKKGERYEKTFYQSVAEIIPRYHESCYPVKNLFFTFCAEHPEDILVEESWAEPAVGVPTIFLCGDSTVTDQSAEIPYQPGACYASWGQDLPAFLQGQITVENQAHCGLTTETFRQEGHMDIVKHFLRPGDLCLFQFGHNDQKLPHLLADREYPINLKRYVTEVRELGGIPVLVTSLGRNIWKTDGTYHELLAEHAQAVRTLAEDTGTALIDLHELSVQFIKSQGMERSCGYFHPGDYTHTNEYGAYLFAALIAKELHRLFPETIGIIPDPAAFVPPDNLWDRISRKNIRTSGSDSEQKEQFDSMEKSTAALLEALRAARQHGLR